MPAVPQSIRRASRSTLARRLASIAVVALMAAGCQASAPTAIVYTAPPDILLRSFPLHVSAVPSASPSRASGASSGPTLASPPASAGSSAAPSGADTSTPSVVASGAASPAPGGSDTVTVGQPGLGEILFGTALGPASCSVINPTSVLRASDPFYFVAHLKDSMDGTQAIVLRVTRDGAEIVNQTQPAGGNAFDCFGNSVAGTLQPGAYEFQVLHGTTVEADGSVTIR